MELEYEEPTPFTGARLTLEVMLGQGWEDEEDIFLEGIILEAQRMMPEAKVCSVRSYLDGVRQRPTVFNYVPSDPPDGEPMDDSKPIEMSLSELDEVIYAWSWRQEAEEHYRKYLCRVAKAAERGEKIPDR